MIVIIKTLNKSKKKDLASIKDSLSKYIGSLSTYLYCYVYFLQKRKEREKQLLAPIISYK